MQNISTNFTQTITELSKPARDFKNVTDALTSSTGDMTGSTTELKTSITHFNTTNKELQQSMGALKKIVDDELPGLLGTLREKVKPIP